MIQEFVDRFIAKEKELKDFYREKHPADYEELVKKVVEAIGGEEYKEKSLDSDRIHKIDDGDYQGTLLFIIGCKGYQPSTYYSSHVSYGSCSGCDALEDLKESGDDKPTEEQTQGYYNLMLHIVQGIKEV